MIDTALSFIVDELNGFLGARFPSQEPLAVLASLANPDGSLQTGTENKLVLSLVNIEREPAAISSSPPNSSHRGGVPRAKPALNLNLYLLVSSNFGSNYRESLKVLSAALVYFLEKPVFNAESASGLPGIERLSIEMVNLATQDLQNIWSITGGKYVPSALYKVRMVTTQEDSAIEGAPAVTSADTKI